VHNVDSDIEKSIVSRFPFSPLTIVKKKLNDKKRRRKKREPVDVVDCLSFPILLCYTPTSNKIEKKPGTSFYHLFFSNDLSFFDIFVYEYKMFLYVRQLEHIRMLYT
jgi:hypothetical protein